MDDVDRRLVALLRRDGRATVAALAEALGVSRGTVTNRMAKLEESGVIAGYTVRLRPDVGTDAIRAWMTIAVEGATARDVIKAMSAEPGVAVLCDTNGRWDLLAEIRAENLQDLAGVLERIRLIKGISSTETSIHLQTYRLT